MCFMFSLASMRTRKPPNCDAVEGHYSSLACHLVNIAYQKKGRAMWQKEWNV